MERAATADIRQQTLYIQIGTKINGTQEIGKQDRARQKNTVEEGTPDIGQQQSQSNSTRQDIIYSTETETETKNIRR
jgi:hypothetical protein